EATTEADFRFDIEGSPNSPWNKSAARVFADFTIRQLCLPNTFDTFEALRRAFTSHLETIIRRYKKSLMSKREQRSLETVKRRQTRKYQLFHRRRYIGWVFKPFRRHVAMLESFGIDGMSSDESETEEMGGDYLTEYQIRVPQWRAGRITPWLRMFDSIHNILRRSGESETRHGSYPRQRRATNRKSTSSNFVAGLPKNAYKTAWLE
ncbi:hypothetical protein B0H11DRAFT_1649308, partial [Mycena galericulata]